jgi:hypothetical protein
VRSDLNLMLMYYFLAQLVRGVLGIRRHERDSDARLRILAATQTSLVRDNWHQYHPTNNADEWRDHDA